MKTTVKWLFIGTAFAGLLAAVAGECRAQDPLSRIKQGISEGKICYKLAEPEDVKALIGAPQEESQSQDGGMLLLELKYPNITILFGKMKDEPMPFTLRSITAGGERLDIGQNKKLLLRNEGDLKKIDRFYGFQNISLARLDLTNRAELLNSMSFDTLTEWPENVKLPAGFDPGFLLENHKNPGLGIRALHRKGIDGRGVGVAVIDQPLLLGHREYTFQIVRYDKSGLLEFPPQMHGSPVTSISVGRDLGVAPAAALTYIAVPMWKNDNLFYIEALKKIFELNKILPAAEKIRVISISDGAFPGQPHYEEWKEILRKAESLGILVVTCDRSVLKYGILAAQPGKDPDDPRNYRPGKYTWPDDILRIPAGNRTLASFRGNDVYMFDRDGGMSWAAPYIAGLAALAFQAAPEIAPQRIIQLLIETAAKTDAGPVVNPEGFIKAVKK